VAVLVNNLPAPPRLHFQFRVNTEEGVQKFGAAEEAKAVEEAVWWRRWRGRGKIVIIPIKGGKKRRNRL